MANHVGEHLNKQRFLQEFALHLFEQPFLLALHSWKRALIGSIPGEGAFLWIQRPVNQRQLIGIP